MIPVSPRLIALAAAALVIAGLGVAVKVQTSRLEACQENHAAFVADVRARGEEQERRAAEQAAADRKAKERSDAEAKRLRADNDRLADRLRDERARSGYVPAAPAGARRPDLACFDRAELERALGQLDAGVSRIAREGDAARIDLDVARRWAAER